MPQFQLGVTPPPLPVLPLSFAGDFNVGVSLAPPSIVLPCGFTIAFPRLTLGLNLSLLLKLLLGIQLPSFFFAFSISCDLSNPINITAGLSLPFGGGRVSNAPPDPDLDDQFP